MCAPVVSGRLFFLGRPRNLNSRGRRVGPLLHAVCVFDLLVRVFASVCNFATKFAFFFVCLLPLCRNARGDGFLVEGVRPPPRAACPLLPVFSLAAVLRCLFFLFLPRKMGVPFSFFIAFAVSNALRWSYIVRIRDTVLVCLFVYMPAGFVNGWEGTGRLERLVPHLFSFLFCVAPPRQQGKSSRRSNGVLLRLYLCVSMWALSGAIYIYI